MRIQTRGNSTNVWLCSDIGVIDGAMTMSAPTLEKILQAVNEKYGTSFEGWSQLPTVYEVGDTVPNWNAYEKIELTSQKIAVVNTAFGQNYFYIIGTLSDENFEIISNGDMSCIVNENGVITGYNAPNSNDTNEIKNKLQNVGITASSITEKVVSWESGTTIPNWEEYTKYK